MQLKKEGSSGRVIGLDRKRRPPCSRSRPPASRGSRNTSRAGVLAHGQRWQSRAYSMFRQAKQSYGQRPKIEKSQFLTKLEKGKFRTLSKAIDFSSLLDQRLLIPDKFFSKSLLLFTAYYGPGSLFERLA
jgi:hypothetical protein